MFKPGTYVVAVSGGVDSIALLHKLATSHKLPATKLIVAHFDHGIREDSKKDKALVKEVAERYKLPFVYDEGRLGQGTSEEAARKARYEFLKKVRETSEAQAIITAHHQDDLLETAIHNLLRGTGRRGMVSLRSHNSLVRPLLHVPKADLIAYAKDQGLVWREDVTNTDLQYRRNYIRHKIMPRFKQEHKDELLRHIEKLRNLDEKIELELTNHLHMHPGVSELDRHWFIMLPHKVAKEVMATWLRRPVPDGTGRRHKVKEISNKMLERLVTVSKTYKPGQKTDVDNKYKLEITKERLKLFEKSQNQ